MYKDDGKAEEFIAGGKTSRCQHIIFPAGAHHVYEWQTGRQCESAAKYDRNTRCKSHCQATRDKPAATRAAKKLKRDLTAARALLTEHGGAS